MSDKAFKCVNQYKINGAECFFDDGGLRIFGGLGFCKLNLWLI